MHEKSKVLIVGGGGVGTIAALNLGSSGRVALTLALRSNFNAVLQNGFHIQSVDHGELKGWRPDTVMNNIPSQSESDKFDYIVVATKNIPDRPPTVAEVIAPAVTPGHTVIVLIQNGLNIEKPIFAKFQSNICLSGISMIGTREDEPSVIIQDGPDVLHIGAFHNPNLPVEKQITAAQDFVHLYSAGGKTECKFVRDVGYSRWRKLLYNACINSTCALTGLDSGRIQLADDAVNTIIKPAMSEIAEAARVCGGHDLPNGLFDQMLSVDPIDMYVPPSMLTDVRKGNFTEYEVILGEPLREGLAHGVHMPVLTVLYRLLKALQWRTKEERGLVNILAKGKL